MLKPVLHSRVRARVPIPHAALCSMMISLLPACGDDGATPTSDSGVSRGPDDDRGGDGGVQTDGALPARLVGHFDVKFIESRDGSGPDGATIDGRVYDGPQPVVLQLSLQREEGDCRLLVPDTASCDVVCEGGALCTEDNVCTPNPASVDVGVVVAEGLDDGPVELTRIGSVYMAPTLSATPCVAGAEVTLSSDAFELRGSCIERLEVPSTDPVPVRAGAATELTWTAPADPSLSRVHIVVDISHHGGKKGEIECDVPDTGAFTIPESLVTDLVGLGVAAFPVVVLRREASTYAATQPELALDFISQVERPIDTGFALCLPAGTCPSGQDCSDAEQCPAGTSCDAVTLLCR